MPESPIEAVNADLYPTPEAPFPLHAWIIQHDDALVAWPSLDDQADIPSNAIAYAGQHGTELPTRGVLSGPPDGWGPGTPEAFLELAGDESGQGTGDGSGASVVNLASLTIPQLREVAATRGVDLTSTRKVDIIAELEAAEAAAAAAQNQGTGDGSGASGDGGTPPAN